MYRSGSVKAAARAGVGGHVENSSVANWSAVTVAARELTYSQPLPRRVKKAKGPTARARAKRKRQNAKGVGEIRDYVFARERSVCRCCRKRRAESMHEIVFRSQGGKVSKKNSIAVCGDGVRGCHGLMQRHEISVTSYQLGAEGALSFWPRTGAAVDWLAVKEHERIELPVMQEMEMAE